MELKGVGGLQWAFLSRWMLSGKGCGPSQSCSRMTAWHTCRAAELQDVDGYVFQQSSMSPSTNNLEGRKALHCVWFRGLLFFRYLCPNVGPSKPLHGHSLVTGSPSPIPLPRLAQPVPEQVCEPACRRSPQEVGQCVEIPDIELVVEGAAEADANEVGGEEDRNDLYLMVKGRSRKGRSWDSQNRGAETFRVERPLALPSPDSHFWSSFFPSLHL